MIRKILYLLLAVSIGVNAGLIITTQQHRSLPSHPEPPTGPREPGPGHRPNPAQLIEDHIQGVTHHLDLTPDQQVALRTVLGKHTPELIVRQRLAAEAGARLSDAFAATVFVADHFQQLTTEASVARASLDSISAIMLVDEAAILTLKQRIRFSEVAPTIHSNPPQPPGQGHRRR